MAKSIKIKSYGLRKLPIGTNIIAIRCPATIPYSEKAVQFCKIYNLSYEIIGGKEEKQIEKKEVKKEDIQNEKKEAKIEEKKEAKKEAKKETKKEAKKESKKKTK